MRLVGPRLLLCLGLWLTASATVSRDLSAICNVCNCISTTINCSSQSLDAIPFLGNETGVKSLDLSRNNIQYVPSSALRGIAGTIQLISLANNLITTIEDGAFANMPLLDTVVLKQNKLSSLPEDVFQNSAIATHITLDLSYNNFGAVPSTSLRNLAGLQSLFLNNNPLQSLPDSTFVNVSGMQIQELDLSYCHLSNENFNPEALNKKYFGTLQKLTLDGNQFTELNAEFFKNFDPTLVTLSLQHCSIKILKHGAFNSFNHLQNLYLDYNDIEVLEKNLFYRIILTTLSIQYCRIATIHRGAFNESIIETLKLNYNNLGRIRQVDFDGLDDMKRLELSNNRISKIIGRPFVRQRKVYLDNNELVDASFENPNNFKPLTELSLLEVLDISRNQLTSLPNLSASASKLLQLRAHHNQITHLSDINLSSLVVLVILDLSYNNITRVSSNAFSNCVNLNELYLEYNPLVQLPSFQNVIYLSQLSISHCLIEALPDDLCITCPQLQKLYLGFNQLKSMPNLSSCKRLHEVSLEKNFLATLNASTFQGLLDLKIIDLSYNSISSLTNGTFQGLVRLKDLFLDFNAIHELPPGIFEDLVNLNRVDLNDNKIQALPDNLFQITNFITDIRLNNNEIKYISPIAFSNNLTYLKRLNLSSNMFSEWTIPKGGFPSLLYLSMANVEQMLQAPDAALCGCPGVQQLEFTYPYHCCLWHEWVNLNNLKPSTNPSNNDVNYTLPPFNPTFPPFVTVIPPFQIANGADITPEFTKILDWFSKAYNVEYRILPGPVVIWYFVNSAHDLTPQPPTVDNTIGTHSVKCSPPGDALRPCDNLMNPWPLRVSIWFILVLALLGNGSVLFVMLASKDKIKVPQFFISNLAFADFCLGIYLAFLACVDARTYGDQFYQSALLWQMGPGCSTAGFIAVFSSELSCSMLVAITLERVYTIYHSPKPGISMSTAIVVALFCWLISLAFAALPLFDINSYSKVAVCLPFVTTDLRDKIYIGVLLTTTMVAFLVIFVSYAVIFCTVCRSPAVGQNKETIKLLQKMAPLIITNILCWFPIAVIGYSALADKPFIGVSLAKWLVVLVYPFNACANPFWYAIFTKNFRHRIRSMFKHTTTYLQTPNAIGLRIHLGQDSKSRNMDDIEEDNKRRRRQSQRSRSVVAYMHTAVIGTLHGQEAPAEPYMGRRASLPAVLRQPECASVPADSRLFQMRVMPHTPQNNSLPNVLEATKCQEVEASHSSHSSDSSRLHKSLSVLREIPEAEDIDDDKKSTVSTHSDEYHDAADFVAEKHYSNLQDLRSLDSCCSSASNAATETSVGSAQHLTSVIQRTTMKYTLDCNTSLIGSETEV